MLAAHARQVVVLVTATALFAIHSCGAGVARADGGAAAGLHAVAYSYEIENLEVRPDDVFVVWPRICSASGEPLGSVDLTLNPDWATRMHDVDYEVMVTGKHHEIVGNCRKTSRLYALPGKTFPAGSRAVTADDNELGQHAVGNAFAIVPLLDVIDRKRRIEFFEKDPRVLRSAFTFDAEQPRATAKALESEHDVLTVGSFTATSFVVSQKSVRYTYQDGTSETVTPPHTDAGPNTDPDANANADANGIGKTAPSSATPPSSPPPPPLDIGTRWVLLAAVGGLLAGGLIAYSRKKKA
jgi:hypothetical protein